MAQNGTEMRRDIGWADDGAGDKDGEAGAVAGRGGLTGAASGNKIVKLFPHSGHFAAFPSALVGALKDAPQWVQLVRFLSAVSAILTSTDAWSWAVTCPLLVCRPLGMSMVLFVPSFQELFCRRLFTF